jgi:hypothetical protein
MTLTWDPIFIVVMKAALGVVVYRTFDTAWLVGNVAVGFAILAVGYWLAGTSDPDSQVQRLRDNIRLLGFIALEPECC